MTTMVQSSSSLVLQQQQEQEHDKTIKPHDHRKNYIITRNTTISNSNYYNNNNINNNSYYYNYLNNMKFIVTITWFILCVGVVMKRYNLIHIFYSFITCSLIAIVCHTIIILFRSTIFNKKPRQHKSSSCINNSNSTNIISTKSNHHRCVDSSVLIGTAIGMIVCLVQCSINIPYTTMMEQRHQLSYSIAAGCLVFDQWYTFCIVPFFEVITKSRNGNNSVKNTTNDMNSYSHTTTTTATNGNYKSILSVLEDAVTLIIILGILVYHHEQQHGMVLKTTAITKEYFTVLLSIIWPIYKLLRLTLVAYNQLLHRSYTSTDKQLVAKETLHHTKNLNNSVEISDNSTITNNLLQPLVDCTNKNDKERHSMIWRIYGIEYDLSNFVHDHPGGYEAIMLGCNRIDCTALFRSYHPSPLSYQHAIKVLQSYRIQPSNSSNNNNNNQDVKKHSQLIQQDGLATTDEFYNMMCERVTKELWERYRFHIVRDRTSNITRILYYLFTIVGFIISGYNYCFGGYNNPMYGSIPFAIFGWLLGALGHDGGHYTVCRSYPMVNNICVWAMCLLCNPIVWQHQHTYAHHSYTNNIAHDPDLHHFTTFLRVHKQFQYYNIYQYQKHPLYVFFAYMFVVFGTCIWIPWGMIQEGSLYGIVQWTDRHRPIRTLGMYLHLFVYTTLIVIVPFLVHKHWYNAWLAVSTHISLSGIIFAIFSQINHINEQSLHHHAHDEPNANNIQNVKTSSSVKKNENDVEARRKRMISSSWAVQQIESSNNFCPQSALWYYLSNGLNLQIEHHLFPGVNHCHLNKIQPIVQDICNEYGVRYQCYNSWKDIMIATLKWLDHLSAAFPKQEKIS